MREVWWHFKGQLTIFFGTNQCAGCGVSARGETKGAEREWKTWVRWTFCGYQKEKAEGDRSNVWGGAFHSGLGRWWGFPAVPAWRLIREPGWRSEPLGREFQRESPEMHEVEPAGDFQRRLFGSPTGAHPLESLISLPKRTRGNEMTAYSLWCFAVIW